MQETAYFLFLFFLNVDPPLAERVRAASSCSTFTHPPMLGQDFVSTGHVLHGKSLGSNKLYVVMNLKSAT